MIRRRVASPAHLPFFPGFLIEIATAARTSSFSNADNGS